MRSVGVVVDPPCFDDVTRLVQVGEQVLVEALSCILPLKRSTKPFSIGLPGASSVIRRRAATE